MEVMDTGYRLLRNDLTDARPDPWEVIRAVYLLDPAITHYDKC